MLNYKLADDGIITAPGEEINHTPPINMSKESMKRKINFKFNLDVLDEFCKFVINVDNVHITRVALTNMRQMIEVQDKNFMSSGGNGSSMMARYEFIELVLAARLDLGVSSAPLIMEHVMRNTERKEIMEKEIIPRYRDLNKCYLSAYAVNYINGLVFENLVEGYSVHYTEELLCLFADRDSGKFKGMKEFSTAFKSVLGKLQKEMRETERFTRANRTFDLSGNYLNAMTDAVTRMKLPSSKLKCGLQFLNKMINGGFESGRVYTFAGVTGVGKSIVLLALAHMIRRYNNTTAKDKTKRPCVVYITQENTFDETLERLFAMTVGNVDIRNYTPEEALELMKTKGGLRLTTDNDIDLVIKYFDDKSISVMDLDDICDELEEEGKEVICLVHDYIQRLKTLEKYTEMRHELGALANDLHGLASRRGIPVITAAQLNRAASSVVENGIINSEKDVTKLLGSQNAAESYALIQNVDSFIVINREYDDTDENNIIEYLAFKLCKLRGKPGPEKLMYFVHPFDQENTISLLEDEWLDKALSRKSVKDFIAERNGGKVQTYEGVFNESTLNVNSNNIYSDFEMNTDSNGFPTQFTMTSLADFNDDNMKASIPVVEEIVNVEGLEATRIADMMIKIDAKTKNNEYDRIGNLIRVRARNKKFRIANRKGTELDKDMTGRVIIRKRTK